MKFNSQIAAALLIILIVIFNSGCKKDLVTEPAMDINNRTDDYWPMQIGNTWTFKYYYYYNSWNDVHIGAPVTATFTGTLTWEIISTTQTQIGVRSTFKQRFVGAANELLYVSAPDSTDSVIFNIVDSTTTFDLTVGSEQIIRLSDNAYPIWQPNGILILLFKNLNLYKYPKDTQHITITYSENFGSSYVTLGRMVGPTKIYYNYVGNTDDLELSMVMMAYTQPIAP